MAKWARETPWRQGQLLTQEAIVAFELTNKESEGDIMAVVISHDCDLAQGASVEPEVELIVGRFIAQASGNFTHCKNLRCLHLECTAAEPSRTIELKILDRRSIPKEFDAGPSLTDYLPRTDIAMTSRERRTLQRWLAPRYERSAFPDEFDRRLKDETGVAERLAQSFKETGNDIIAVFFDVDTGKELTRLGSEDTYDLLVTLVFSTSVDALAAEAVAKNAAKRIREIFRARCLVKDGKGVETWQWIELAGVDVISDEALTYAQSIELHKWQADHISLRTDPVQPFLGQR